MASELLNFDWRAVTVLGCSTVSCFAGKNSTGVPLVQLKLDLADKAPRSATQLDEAEGPLSAPIAKIATNGYAMLPSRSLIVELDSAALSETIKALHNAISQATN